MRNKLIQEALERFDKLNFYVGSNDYDSSETCGILEQEAKELFESELTQVLDKIQEGVERVRGKCGTHHPSKCIEPFSESCHTARIYNQALDQVIALLSDHK